MAADCSDWCTQNESYRDELMMIHSDMKVFRSRVGGKSGHAFCGEPNTMANAAGAAHPPLYASPEVIWEVSRCWDCHSSSCFPFVFFNLKSHLFFVGGDKRKWLFFKCETLLNKAAVAKQVQTWSKSTKVSNQVIVRDSIVMQNTKFNLSANPWCYNMLLNYIKP